MAKVLIGNFKGPKGDKGDKGDVGTAATIQVGTTQTVQPEENAEVTNTGTANAAVLNFKIPRGEDGMTDLVAEYEDDSSYTCEPTSNAPVILKEILGKTEQGADPSPDNPQAIKGVGGTGYFDGAWRQGSYDISGVPNTSDAWISFVNKIPCKANDNIKVSYDKTIAGIRIFYWNTSGGFLSSEPIDGKETTGWTAPATAGSFVISFNDNNISPSTAAYCTVTINGEYATAVETQGRNLANVPKEKLNQTAQLNIPKFKWTGKKQLYFKYSASTNQTDGSVLLTVVYLDKNGNRMGTNGDAFKTGTGFAERARFFDGVGAGTQGSNVDLSKVDYIYCFFYIQNSSATQFSVKDLMISDSDLTNADYIPYHHTALTIPLTSPLFEGDKICYVRPGESYVNADGETVTADGVLYGCYRENASVVFDGSSDENWNKNAGDLNQNDRFYIIVSKSPYATGLNKSNMLVWQIYATEDNSFYIDSNKALFIRISNITDVNALKTWLSANPLTVVYRLAQPYFEPFTDQSIFYDLRTDDTLTYIYSSDPIEPNIMVDVAKNSTGGYLLESYSIIAQLVGRTVVVEK